MSDKLAIYDALLWEPSEGYFLLDYHLRRLERSAAHFRFPLDVGIARRKLSDYEGQLPKQPRKVRLDLSATGSIGLRDEAVKPSTPVAAAFSGEAVRSGDEFLHHKTTHRDVYDRALLALDRGEIQEQVLPVDSIKAASAVFLINSVRRWCEIRLVRHSLLT